MALSMREIFRLTEIPWSLFRCNEPGVAFSKGKLTSVGNKCLNGNGGLMLVQWAAMVLVVLSSSRNNHFRAISAE